MGYGYFGSFIKKIYLLTDNTKIPIVGNMSKPILHIVDDPKATRGSREPSMSSLCGITGTLYHWCHISSLNWLHKNTKDYEICRHCEAHPDYPLYLLGNVG